ncbi:TOMM precursor leader peptide-binding protein [Micromonospora carbonacea]|uniref:TOMM precursor leader peptide-binding protein n=1 Tax=Micromonospora carbonacea TaxID=47853 RepID=UPI003D73D153
MSGALTAAGRPARADLTATLARLLRTAVPVWSAVAPTPRDDPGLRVVVDPGRDADLTAPAFHAAPVLPVYGIRGRLVVGPLVEAGVATCPNCLALRVRALSRPESGTDDPAPVSVPLSRRDVPWPAAATRMAAAVVADEVRRLEAGADPRTRGTAFVVDVTRASADWHEVVPHHACASATCRDARRPVPPPRPDLARPRPARSATSGRRFSLDHFRQVRDSGYLDPWSGVVTAPAISSNAALPAVQAKVPTRWGFQEICIGHADTVADARTAAVLEGLERYAGWHSGGRRPARVAAFAELDDAIDPRRLLLHEADAYRQPGFPYVPFRPDLPVAWAEAYDVTGDRSALLPFHVAYYGATREPGLGPSFVYENSNGCALGAGPEEALLAALLEVVERDAFLRAWYSRTPLPELDLAGLTGSAALTVRTVAHRTGRTLRAFRAVGELGLPVVLLVSLSDEPGQPATLVTAGCALDTTGALLGAAHEMALVAPVAALNFGRRRAELDAMLAEPERVRAMADHALAAALPAARDRFDFLLDPPVAATPVEPTHLPRGDVAADLAALLAAAADAGLRVLVVDHTTPELHRVGLTCVKAVLPGTVPMTFGHRHRRMPSDAGLESFRRRHHATPLTEVRHDPHPFP